METIPHIIQAQLRSAKQNEKFTYSNTSLGQDEVRILLLLPDCNRADSSDIHCYLVRLNLQETENRNLKKHPFVALSYYWGPVEPHETIFINGREKTVGPELYQALRHTRDAMAPVSLWIDAICINQDNEDEKSKEILKMQRIYAECWMVLYWLGVEDNNAEFVDGFRAQYRMSPAKAMSQFGDIYDTLCELGEEHNRNAFDTYDELSLQDDGPRRFVLLEALSYFMDLPFWRRVWITQEFILSRDGFFMWGVHTFNMKALDGLLQIRDEIIPRNTFSMNLRRYLKVYSMLIESIRMRSSEVRFQEALVNVRYRLASNELDYVYGMIGISGVQSFKPNYNKKKEEVYLDAFREVLSQESNLDILSACDRGWAECASRVADKSQWPTWLPDWSYAPLKVEGIHIRSLLLDLQMHAPARYLAAAASTQAEAYILEGGKRLCVKGVEFDTVAQIIGSSRDDWKEKAIGLWKEGRLCSIYTTADTFQKTCEKTELYGRHKSYISDEFHKQFESLKEETGIPTIDAENPVLFDEGGESDDEEYASKSSLQRTFLLDEVKSTIFITRRGFLGRSPSSVEVNDKVCVFLGGKVPFLLRQEDQHFRLAGETYIRGIMKGAALAAMKGQEKYFILV